MANPLVCIFNPITTLIDQIQSQSTFVGPSAAGAPVVLNALGELDPSLLGQGISATAGELIVAGALVNLYNNAGSLYMQNAYAAATGVSPSGKSYPVDAVGFSANNVSINNTSLVLFTGTFTYADPNSEFTANSIGSEVYLRATPPAGGVTLTRPSSPGQLVQSVGNVVGFTAPNFVLISYIASPQPPFSSPGGVSTNVQFNNSGVFGGIPGSTADGANGLMTLAPSGTGVGLTITGDAHTSNIQNWIINGGSSPATAIDASGNVVLNAGIKDHTGSLGTSGQSLTSTGSQTLWASLSATPGGTATELQFNNSGSFGGAANSSVSVSGAVVLGNTNNPSPTASTAFTVSGSGGISTSAQDWYSSNEGTTVAQMFTSGRLTLNGVNIISNVSIGAFPALVVNGGNAGSPDVADFITSFGATPASTKTVWIDFNGNLHLAEGLWDHTGSPGTSGQVLSSTGSQVTWVSPTSAAGGTPTQIQYNLAGALTGIAGSAVTAAGAVTLAPTSTGTALSLYSDGTTDPIQNWFVQSALNPGITVQSYGDARGLKLFMQDNAGATVELQPGTFEMLGETEGHIFLIPGTGGGGQATFTSTPVTIDETTAVNPVVALSVVGDPSGSHIQNWFVNGVGTAATYIDTFGNLFIAPPVGSGTRASLNVTGGTLNEDIADFFSTSFPIPAAPVVSINQSGGVVIEPLYSTSTGNSVALTVIGATGNFSGFYQDILQTYTNSNGSFDVVRITGGGTLALNGGYAPSVLPLTGAYTATSKDYTMNCNGTFTLSLAPFSFTLASSSGTSGSPFSITYTGTITGGAANAYAGAVFTIAGFTNAGNNGTFICTASTGTTLTVTSYGVAAAAESAAATAAVVITTGQLYQIKNIGTGVITVSSSVNIDGATSLTLSSQYVSVIVQWDGTQWWVY